MTTIDQDWVRDAIERHSDASGGNGRDFHNGAYAAIADEIEQAIAATLGADPRERGLIPHFWTGDWTLHIETAKLPERIDVTLPDERGREVRSARVHRFVPEQMCRYELKDGWLVCSNCGRSTRAYEGKGDPLDPPNFCPDCGAKVVEE